MALSDAAKAEIKAAIAIIREDKLYGFVRKASGQTATPPPATDPGKPATPPGPPAPPAKPGDPPADPPKLPATRSAWWGEIMDD